MIILTDLDPIYKETLSFVTDCLKQISINSQRIQNPKDDLKLTTATLLQDIQRHPAIHAYYAGLKAICSACINECTKTLELIDGELYDYYKTSYALKLSTQEIKHYITHDDRHRELTRIIVLVDREMVKISAILEAVVSRGYSINNIVKLMQIKQEQARLEEPMKL